MGKPSVFYSIRCRSCLAGFWLLFLFCIFSFTSHAGQYERYVVGTVIKVRDGDTVSVRVANTDEILEVRLYGINAPEKNQSYYTESTEYLTNQILGKHVDLYITGKGKFHACLFTSSQEAGSKDNHYIAKVYCDSKYINLMLVSSGLAVHYKQFSKDRALLWPKLKQGGVVLEYGINKQVLHVNCI